MPGSEETILEVETGDEPVEPEAAAPAEPVEAVEPDDEDLDDDQEASPWDEIKQTMAGFSDQLTQITGQISGMEKRLKRKPRPKPDAPASSVESEPESPAPDPDPEPEEQPQPEQPPAKKSRVRRLSW